MSEESLQLMFQMVMLSLDDLTEFTVAYAK